MRWPTSCSRPTSRTAPSRWPPTPIEVHVAGRLMVKRVMGGTSFVKLQDRSGQIQLMLKRDRLGEALYGEFKKWDVGDIVARARRAHQDEDRRAVRRRQPSSGCS